MEEAQLRDIKDKVTSLTDQAFLLQRDNRIPESVVVYDEAFQLERQRADWYVQTGEEPLRTEICLNAAHLACDAGLTAEAEYYANKVIEFGINEVVIEQAKVILKQ